MCKHALAAGFAIIVIAAAGVTALVPREAQACSLASLRIEDAAGLADVVAIGELRTEGVDATLHVAGYFQGDTERAELPIDNRQIDLAADCGETPVPKPDHEGGEVVAFLRETEDGRYRGISAGRGIFRAEVALGSGDTPVEEAARSEFGQPAPPNEAADAADSGEDGSGPGLLWLAILGSAGTGAGAAILLGLREQRRDRRGS